MPGVIPLFPIHLNGVCRGQIYLSASEKSMGLVTKKLLGANLMGNVDHMLGQNCLQ